ncbi:hypothetical protein I7I51_04523 [Histoplasma capsulatum]|uniref:Uncharacterized protein n=1 Tax=Ajellomyces capsulatus TaxID=5037 RepID=A0A8A1M9A7_AJECA|nr:hypothetical protein I7I51_04523 [Histoplasma capsulatum]
MVSPRPKRDRFTFLGHMSAGGMTAAGH